jgi:hypothetical protein
VVLTISDHLDWIDTISHQQTLQEKLNRYLSFVESGEILEGYPDAKYRPVVIQVVTKYDPDPSGTQFLQRARGAIERAGLAFEQRTWVGPN